MFALRPNSLFHGLLLAIGLLLVGCAQDSRSQRLHGRSMGGTWSVTYVAASRLDDKTLSRVIQTELDLVVAQMSSWEPDSDISRFNRAHAGRWQVLPAEFFHVLEYALTLAAASGGAYDPSIGALVDVWGFGAHAGATQPPAAGAIAAAKAHVDWRRIELDRIGQRVRQPGGLQLDVSSIAKGYAVDRIAQALQAQGIEAFLIEVAGELRAAGQRGDSTAWRVAIESPRPNDDPDSLVTGAGSGATRTLAVRDMALATSGDYRRFFAHDGQHYSHEIDPRSGYPVQGDLASVSVLASECMHADALATALFVLGPEAGLAYALSHNLAALFVLRDGTRFREQVTPAFAEYVN